MIKIVLRINDMKSTMQQASLVTRYLVLCVLLIIAATGTLSGRGLYADGPFWLYHMLLNGGFYIFDTHRAFAQFVVEWPVYLAINLGVHDLNTLIRVHSFGFVGIPIMFWCGALILQFRTPVFWLLALACSVTYLRSGFFAAGEFNAAYGLVALSVAIVLKKQVSIFQNLILLGTAVVLIYAYESMLFIGIFLFVTCLVRLLSEKHDSGPTKLAMVLSGFFYLYAAYIGVRSTFYDRAEDLRATINYGALFEFHVLYLILMIACAGLMLIGPIRSVTKAVFAVMAAILSALYILFILRWDTSGISYGFYSYAYRSLGAFMLVGILCLAWVITAFPALVKYGVVKVSVPLLACVVSLVFFLQSGTLIFHTLGYYRWLKTFEAAALTVDGLVPIDHTILGKGYASISGYNWPWSNATLSVLLRGNAEAMITNASNFDGWETFDPRTIERYPLKTFTKSVPLFP